MLKSISVVAAMALAAGASAASWTWNWTSAQGGGSINNSAGTFQSISASYDNNTKLFVWNATFSNQTTTGYTLAVNKGPNPKGKPGELALIYFDATTSFSSPKVSAFGYNGANGYNSFSDGDGIAAGNQAVVKIHTSATQQQAVSWLKNANVVDSNGKRTFNLTVDTSVINSSPNQYTSQYGMDWTGLQFADQLGLWMHTFKGISTHYTSGTLDGWTIGGSGAQGYFDGAGFSTILAVPLPSAAALGFVGLVCIARRRRFA